MCDFLIDENIPLIDVILSRHFQVLKKPGREINNETLKELNPICLIVRSQTKIDFSLVEGTPIKFIATATSGTDHVDVDYLKNKRIRFTSTIGSNAVAVAEYVLFAMLHWSKVQKIELEKKKIGIVGFGNIGKRLAYFAHSIGLEIFVNDPPLKDMGFKFPDFMNYVDLRELVSSCDIITNHIPLTHTGKYPTYNLFNSELLKNIKSNSLFIHTSRGGIVDEDSLLEFIQQGKVQAVIDVWENEPNFNSKLSELALIATPHIAGYSYDGKLNGVLMIIDAVSKYFRKKFYVAPIVDLLANNVKFDITALSNEQIYDKLLNSRKLLIDSELFKNSSESNDFGGAKIFELTRREYPFRREVLISPFD